MSPHLKNLHDFPHYQEKEKRKEMYHPNIYIKKFYKSWYIYNKKYL